MRALITGAGGFVGVHLVRHLEEQGDDVVQLERNVDGIDITDADALTDAVVAAKPEAVYHLAGAADVGGSWAEPRSSKRFGVPCPRVPQSNLRTRSST